MPSLALSPVFQSTLPRGERRVVCSIVKKSVTFQSTLPRGERHTEIDCGTVTISISIHAPTRGATTDWTPCFTPTLISIHAPTRGATTFRMIVLIPRLYFNPRSHEGSDVSTSTKTNTLLKFQSTLPRGERHGIFGMMYTDPVFQSTLPRGERRYISKRLGYGVCISIHAPTRGATENKV